MEKQLWLPGFDPVEQKIPRGSPPHIMNIVKLGGDKNVHTKDETDTEERRECSSSSGK